MSKVSIKSTLLLTLILISNIKTEDIQPIEFCTEDTKTDLNLCKINEDYNKFTENIVLDFRGRSGDYKIVCNGAKITSNFRLVIQPVPEITNFVIEMTLCSFKARELIFDIHSKTSHIYLRQESRIGSDAFSLFQNIKEVTKNLLQNPCFAGCLFDMRQLVYGLDYVEDKVFNQWSEENVKAELFSGVSGYETIYKGQNLSEDEPLPEAVRGGGYVYLKVQIITLDKSSRISANAFQGLTLAKTEKYLRAGTGGSVIISCFNISFENISDTDTVPRITAEGARLDDQALTLNGGGGRIYIQLYGSEQSTGLLESILPYLSTTGFYSAGTDIKSNSGTMYIQFGKIKIDRYLVLKNTVEKQDPKETMVTVIKSSMVDDVDPKQPNLNFVCQATKPVFEVNQKGFKANSFNSQSCDILFYRVIEPEGSFDTTIAYTAQEIILNNSQLSFQLTGRLVMHGESKIQLIGGSIIWLYPNIELIFTGASFELLEKSMIKGTFFDFDSQFSQSRASSNIQIYNDKVTLQESSIEVDQILIGGPWFDPESPKITSIKEEKEQQIEILEQVTLGNLRGFCVSAGYTTEIYEIFDEFLVKCKLDPSTKATLKGGLTCAQIWSDFYKLDFQKIVEAETSDTFYSRMNSYVMLRFKNKLFSPGLNFKIVNASYVYLYASSIDLDPSSNISASSAGCPTVIPKIDSALNKYLKACKVIGGSHIGRGTLGKEVNLELCKFLIPDNEGIKRRNFAISGQGGQKSHQVFDKSRNGYGGGVINLFGEIIIHLQGKLKSNGGKAELKDYSMVAGGAGGTIKLNSLKLKFKFDQSESGSTASQKSTLDYLSVKGGDPENDMGAGGGGKILLNCLNWIKDPECIEIYTRSLSENAKNLPSKISIDKLLDQSIKVGSGEFKEIPNTPQYFMTMHMFEQARSFIFQGGVLNLNPCLPGRGGSFCQACPIGYYKSTIDNFSCIPCPCFLNFSSTEKSPMINESKHIFDNLEPGLTDIGQCLCKAVDQSKRIVLRLVLTILIFSLLMGVVYMAMNKKKKYDDKSFLSDFRYKPHDIPNSLGRIFVSGSNTPDQPWKIDRLNAEFSDYFESQTFSKFRQEFYELSQWSKLSTFLLSVIKLFFYSPIYLFLMRVMRVKRVNLVIQHLERQFDYKFFKPDQEFPLLLKWFTTSDQSTIFLDIVRKVEDANLKLNWILKFPQAFVIFGKGTYNRPFKLEMRDPLLIKTMDHLKSIIADNQSYLEAFGVPSFIVSTLRVSNQHSHFLEYYFCVLNAMLKSLSSYDMKIHFVSNFQRICNFLQQANDTFLTQNGFVFKLELLVEKTTNKRKKKDIIPVILEDSEQRKKVINFFYRLCNNHNEDVMYAMRLCINNTKARLKKQPQEAQDDTQSQASLSPKKLKRKEKLKKKEQIRPQETSTEEIEEEKHEISRNSSLRREIDHLELSLALNEVVTYKNQFMDKIMKEKRQLDLKYIDFEALDAIYISNKKANFLLNNLIVRFASSYIYKQQYIKRSLNYMPGLIFMLLMIEMVIVMFSIYNIFIDNLLASPSVKAYVVLEWLGPFPLSQFFSVTMGMLCFVSSWKVKIGKMFVSANMISVVNLSISFILWVIYTFLMELKDLRYVALYVIPSLMIRLLLSYTACIQVSRIQTLSTMQRIMKSKIQLKWLIIMQPLTNRVF